MKNIIIILIIALFSSNLLATKPLGNGDKKCRLDVTNIDAMLTVSEQLTKDLLSGIWTKDVSSSSDANDITSFQFTKTGLVGVLTQSMENITNYSNQQWHLEVTNNNLAILVLTDLNANKIHSYHVTRHCEGLHLVHVETGKLIDLIYTPKQQNKKVSSTIKTLTGSWKSMIVSSNDNKTKGAFYKYELNKDGSLEKVLDGENMEAIVQKGFWQISPNGQYLMMHFQEEEEFNTHIAEISYLAFDELVLGKSMATTDLEKELCANAESFYFNKQ